MWRYKFYGHLSLQFLLLGTFLVVYFHSYPELLTKILSLSTFRNKEKIVTQVFDLKVYNRLIAVMAFLNLLHALMMYRNLLKPVTFARNLALVKRSINYFGWLKRAFKILTSKQIMVLALLLTMGTVLRSVLANNIPVIYDEAYTYLAFTSKNPLLTAFFYPTSNNHVLFSHLTQLTGLLPFDILYNLRISSIVINMLAVLTFFFCLKNRSNFKTALIFSLLLSIAFPMLFYGFAARGYSLVLFFFVIGLFTTTEIAKQPGNPVLWYRLSLSSALGMYSVPTFLYPMITLYGYLFVVFIYKKRPSAFFNTLTNGMLTVFLIGMLYLPIFVLSGPDAVLGNKYVVSNSLSKVVEGLGSHLKNNLYFYSGQSRVYLSLFTLVLVLVTSVFVLKKTRYELLSISLFAFVFAPILMFLHRIIPVERTWIYLCIPFTLLLASAYYHSGKYRFVFYFLLVFPILNAINFREHINWYDKVCEEDSPQGQYFNKYFHGKNAVIITSNRMNSYLKFNQIRFNENWEINEDLEGNLNHKTYYLQYLRDEKKDSIPFGFEVADEYKGYRLLSYKK
ncbi:MAG: hypothetical protein H6605_03560 [Flavobacteriales bacterium]|nr:hypothetical protein [Flavobacteriales bacterium]